MAYRDHSGQGTDSKRSSRPTRNRGQNQYGHSEISYLWRDDPEGFVAETMATTPPTDNFRFSEGTVNHPNETLVLDSHVREIPLYRRFKYMPPYKYTHQPPSKASHAVPPRRSTSPAEESLPSAGGIPPPHTALIIASMAPPSFVSTHNSNGPVGDAAYGSANPADREEQPLIYEPAIRSAQGSAKVEGIAPLDNPSDDEHDNHELPPASSSDTEEMDGPDIPPRGFPAGSPALPDYASHGDNWLLRTLGVADPRRRPVVGPTPEEFRPGHAEAEASQKKRRLEDARNLRKMQKLQQMLDGVAEDDSQAAESGDDEADGEEDQPRLVW